MNEAFEYEDFIDPIEFNWCDGDFKVSQAIKTQLKEFEFTTEDVMPKINGEHFRCDCVCNVFRRPEIERPLLYACNSCGERWIGEK